MKKTFVVIIVLGIGISAYGYLGFRTTEFVPEVSTVTLARGDVVDTVGATGALEAVTTVQVGSQVSGMIEALFADFNSIVREGDVIARLEPSIFEMQTEQARANLARSEADVERLRVTLEDTQAQLARSEDLAARDLISDSEFEAAQIAVRSAAAQIRSAEASVIQSRASLNQSEVSLGHTVITAPIDGIVIARQVDVGQTVAASMSAPELFIIAADLTKMQVVANIDESDVGRIRPGQLVTFTVDAYAAEEFTGRVSQIRLEPVLLQNVVSYATVIDVPNNDLKLKPGMTATVTLEISRRENVLRVPTAALRFRPTPAMFAALNQPVPEFLQRGADERESSATPRGGGFGDMSDPDRQAMRERIQSMTPEQRAEFFASRRGAAGTRGSGGRGGGPGSRNGVSGSRQRTELDIETAIPAVERGATTIDALFSPLEVPETNGRVWVLSDDRLSPVEVQLGVTDGTATELLTVGASSPAPRPSQPPQDVPQVAELRRQVAALNDPNARQNLERLIQRLEADQAPRPSQVSPSRVTTAALEAGTQLVTGVTTPAEGASAPSPAGGSPLIPQFGRGRRR
ncbi:MAG: efflux RND transporter periplasmic adaptor subunit [Acidobacteriota bacterium]|nr:efflux RND transporter periplasmic adaptor subunit [Acidobacteriota bacterium]